MKDIVLSGAEETIISALNDPIYSVEYVKKWINRNDNVFINAPAALVARGVKGFYSAVQAIDRGKWRI